MSQVEKQESGNNGDVYAMALQHLLSWAHAEFSKAVNLQTDQQRVETPESNAGTEPRTLRAWERDIPGV